MATSYDVIVSGANATTIVIPPVNGRDGTPLGPAGNGADGVAGPMHRCKQQAGAGMPGNGAFGAAPALGGANGGNAFSVTITCTVFSGTTLTLGNFGGNGADGNSGGVGGTGSAGGEAGSQPKGCSLVVHGGVGGGAGAGGNAGGGGNAGNASDVIVLYGTGLSGGIVSATNSGGGVGKCGVPGDAGAPGLGGTGSDGVQANSGGNAGAGRSGAAGNGGYGGSYSEGPDTTKPGSYLKLSIQTNTSGQ